MTLDKHQYQNARQFLFTTDSETQIKDWNKLSIDNFNLWSHKKLEVTQVNNDQSNNIILIGYLFDYENYTYSNKDILEEIIDLDFTDFLLKLNQYTGQFIIIRSSEGKINIIGDAGAQRELYYTTDYNHFASQPNLLERYTNSNLEKNDTLSNFYSSNNFSKNNIYIYNTTQWDNVLHMRANHYLDLTQNKEIRFFPNSSKSLNSIEYVLDESEKRIKGFLKAVASRYEKIAIPVTAGYDSRLIYAASKVIDCRYFIFEHRKLSEKHYDIAIPKQLLKADDKSFEIITYPDSIHDIESKIFEDSIDYNRIKNAAFVFNGYAKNFSDYVVLDTIMSELARNRYGNFKKLNAKELAYLNHYKGNVFVINQYENWLQKSEADILKHNYNIPDIFYWEEIMGNWAAKSKSEYGLGTEFFSILNSRDLITLMMSVDIKYRQINNNMLYNRLIGKMCPLAIKYPVNPSAKTSIQIFMQKLRIFDIYRFIKTKFMI